MEIYADEGRRSRRGAGVSQSSRGYVGVRIAGIRGKHCRVVVKLLKSRNLYVTRL